MTRAKTNRTEPAQCVIAIAASAGGLNALSVILGGLPADFPAAIANVMHLSPDHKSLLAEILATHYKGNALEAKLKDMQVTLEKRLVGQSTKLDMAMVELKEERKRTRKGDGKPPGSAST